MKRSGDADRCAAYGPGFVKVVGSDTCAKLGGAVSLGGTAGRLTVRAHVIGGAMNF